MIELGSPRAGCPSSSRPAGRRSPPSCSARAAKSRRWCWHRHDAQRRDTARSAAESRPAHSRRAGGRRGVSRFTAAVMAGSLLGPAYRARTRRDAEPGLDVPYARARAARGPARATREACRARVHACIRAGRRGTLRTASAGRPRERRACGARREPSWLPSIVRPRAAGRAVGARTTAPSAYAGLLRSYRRGR